MAQTIDERFAPATEAIPAYRNLILGAHLTLGLVAVGALAAHCEIWRTQISFRSGLSLTSVMLLAALPYGACAIFSWRFMTTRRWRPWLYVKVLIAGTVFAAWLYSRGARPLYFVYQVDLIAFQLIAFYLAAEWALDGENW